jgi:tetratricopeptide (TPR) repeat protein
MRKPDQGMFEDAVRCYQDGKLAEAEQLFRRILETHPRHAGSLHALGLIAYQAGLYESAAELLDKAIAIEHDNPTYHSHLGNILIAQGRVNDAASRYERALALKPDCAEAHNNLGIALAAQGKFAEAVEHYECALILNPRHANAHNNLGGAFKAQSRMDEAITHFRRALAINRDHPEAHNNLGTALYDQGNFDDAMAHYRHVLTLNPNHADVHNNLGIILKSQGKMDEAAAHYRQAIAINPSHAEAHNNLGNVCKDQDRLDDAIEQYRLAIAINPDSADAHNNLANLLKDQGKFDDAMAHYGRAIAIRPDYAEAHFNRAEIKTFQEGDPDLAAMEAMAGRDGLPANKAPYLHFALAKALEDSGDYVRVFEQLRKGNSLKRRQITYDEQEFMGLCRRISSAFDAGLFDRFRGEGDPSSTPIFVLGMPRSGSTLIEQILASHPQVHAAGELVHLEMAVNSALNTNGGPLSYPECVPALDSDRLRRIGQAYLERLPVLAHGKIRIVNKLPANFLHVGLIRLILPNARIIHTMRNPIDTCVSCYSKLFASGQYFSYDLGELGRFYRCYTGMMSHWRSVLPPGAMFDVSYEEVVDDLEGQARRLIDYCGLPWDNACLTFHRASRPVKTASAVQVRKPLFRSSLQRWRKYEADLAPLLRELGDLIPGHTTIQPSAATEAQSLNALRHRLAAPPKVTPDRFAAIGW